MGDTRSGRNEYDNAVDNRVLSFIGEVKERGSKAVAPIEIGEINKAHADILRELTGKDYSGYKIMLTGDAIEHILKSVTDRTEKLIKVCPTQKTLRVSVI
jgi:hypothetical protein